ncbi:hypothetical protein QTP86_008827 [Hemibagrus guttatus]|nr:hypothetical protein QTP86_008827 [Hemibagrus guttatus]
MFKHKGAHQYTWYQDTLGWRSMINLVVVSSDLRLHVLDTRVKRGAELSPTHHLVVRWIRLWRRMPDRLGRPKRIVRIPREVGDIESEWTMFSSSIVDTTIRSCGHKVSGAGRGSNPQTQWWTLEVRDAVKLKKESYRAWFAQWTPEAAEAYRQAKRARWSRKQKLESGRSLVRPSEGLGEILADCLAPQKGRGTLDQLYTLHRVLEGSWEFAQPVHMCFVDLEKAFDCGILWEVLWEYGVCGPLLRAVQSLYDQSRSLVRIASSECEAAGMSISISKSEAMILDRKKVACTLQVGGEFLPEMEEFKYLGVLFTSKGRMDRESDRQISAAAAVMWSMYRSVVVKKELSRKAKLSIYQSTYVPTLTYGHEVWVMTERIRSWIQVAEMSFLCRVAGRSLRDRVRSSVTREELGAEPLLLHIERGQLRWLGHLFRMPPGCLPGEVFWACPTGKRPRGRPRARWRDYVHD